MTFTQKLNLMRFHPQSLIQLKMMMPNTLPVSDLELHHSRGNGSSCCSTEATPISSYVCTSKRENENWRGMIFYMHGVLDKEVVGWTSSLALKGFCSICKMGQDAKVYRFTPLFEVWGFPRGLIS